MHDIDRTQAESWVGEFEDEYDGEFEDEYDGEFEDEYDGEFEDEYEGETSGIFSEADEMELAAELLEVNDEQELDQFIGKLIRRGLKKTKFGRKLLNSRFAKALTKIHKGVRGISKKLLPVAGSVAGGVFGGPVGAQLGGRLASAASKVFELELEGLGPEDQEFEVARNIVRLGGEAVRQATMLPKRGSPEALGQTALAAAARKHAPGLVKRGGRLRKSNGSRGRPRGTWERRGNQIIIHGI